MRKCWLLVVPISVVVAILVFCELHITVPDGRYFIRLFVESREQKPISIVESYWVLDPADFPWYAHDHITKSDRALHDSCERIGDTNCFEARVWCSKRYSPLRITQSYRYAQPRHLAIFVEYADGTRAAELLPLPDLRKGPREFTVEVP